jgi:hypothetical protein
MSSSVTPKAGAPAARRNRGRRVDLMSAAASMSEIEFLNKPSSFGMTPVARLPSWWQA